MKYFPAFLVLVSLFYSVPLIATGDWSLYQWPVWLRVMFLFGVYILLLAWISLEHKDKEAYKAEKRRQEMGANSKPNKPGLH